MVLLEEMDIRGTVNGLLEPEIARLEQAYVKSLEQIAPFGKVSSEVLDGLAAMDVAAYQGQIGAAGEELQRLIARSAISGAGEARFAADLRRTGLQPHQANALANDSLRKYQRQVKDQMAQSAPDDKLYIYEGPDDDKTDDYCVEMLGAGPLTYDQVDSQFPGTFTDGGHFNCRHSWEPFVRSEQDKRTEEQRQQDGDEFVPAKSVKEAEAWAKNVGVTGNYSDVSVDVSNAVNGAIHRNLVSSGTNVGSVINSVRFKGTHPRLHTADVAGSELTIYGVKNIDDIILETASAKRFGSMVPDSFDEILDHEIGHLLHNRARRNQLNKWDSIAFSEELGVRKSSNIVYESILDGEIGSFTAAEIEQIRRRGFTYSSEWAPGRADYFKRHVSEYAARNPDEAFAETYCLYMRGGKLPPELSSMIKKAL
jgi:hypothetical protein